METPIATSPPNWHKSEVPQQERASYWRILLSRGNSYASYASNVDEAKILATTLDLENQRVVKADVNRTRIPEEQKEVTEKLLTFYCKTQKIKYKQGLNELIAPFVNFYHTNHMELDKVYACFSMFINKYLPTFYIDEDFISLQGCLILLKLLVRYHDPRLSTFLEECGISPEMYATPWMLTYFANKLEAEHLYELWDLVIHDGDPYLLFYLGLAFLLINKETIIDKDASVLPQALATLKMGSP